MAIDPAWIALGTTICGGIALKVAEHYLGKSRVKIDDATRIREEQRMEIDAQRIEIRELENGINKWREDYYNLRDEHMKLQTQLTIALDKIKNEIEENKNNPGT